MKISKLAIPCSAVVITILATAYRVPAQYEYRSYTMPSGIGGVFNNSISATISANMWNRAFSMVACRQVKGCEEEMAKLSRTNANSSRSSTNNSPQMQSQTAAAKPLNESALRFRPDGAYIKTREFADQLGSNPAERDQYFKLMNAVLDGFGQKVAAAGLQNDLAIALSYFFGENLRIYRGESELSDEQFMSIRNLIAQVLLAQDSFNMTDRQKREMYEGLVAYTGITQFGYEQAKQANNAEMARGFQKVASLNLQAITRMSPDRLTGN